MDTLEILQKSEENPSILHENVLLKKLNREALMRIDILEKKVKDLAIQNQALWSQVCQQGEREDTLKQMINNLMKISNITPNQLPILAKADPSLLATVQKSEKDALTNLLFSQGFANSLQQAPLNPVQNYMNIGDFLRRSDSVSDQKENSRHLSNLVNLLNNTSYVDQQPNDTAGIDEKLLYSLSQANGIGKPEEPVLYQTQPKLFNLEAEYLRALASSDQWFNPASQNTAIDFGNASVLGKRPLNLVKTDGSGSLLSHQDSFSSVPEFKLENRADSMSFIPSIDESNSGFEGTKHIKRDFEDKSLVDLMNLGLGASRVDIAIKERGWSM